ncbi:MAG: Asp-tRNA(Asn)/Glu-tRNA(Gln) amidotransferase subunit GatA [Clostridia bacterium]|nr:Asp-tRNA(Asn)/Glu-tRNA(Gln) amidotransferase subunit GatA [Clostridia bacterium]
MNNDIIALTVKELADLTKKRSISSQEITKAYIDRICETEPKVNAYITETFDLAIDQAKAADDAISAGNLCKPLCGVPYAVKDNVAVSGVRMTCASEMLRDFVPQYTATVCENVGGVVLGKTNLDEFAMGSACERSIIGATHNPIDLTRSAGGSSGGSAATVAARSAPWAIATDTGGSARQPASFCGVVSMKPTYGIISRYGVTELASSLDTVCPITRNVYDNALVLESMVGRDQNDMTSVSCDGGFTSGIENGVRGLRIGMLGDSLDMCEDEAVVRLFRAADKLKTLGAEVDSLEPGAMPPLDVALSSYFVIASAECSSNMARYDGLRYGFSADGEDYSEMMRRSRDRSLGDEVKRRMMSGAYALSRSLGGGHYLTIKEVQTEICRAVAGLFEKYDIILMPTAAGVPFKLGDYSSNPTALYASDSFTTMANLTGCPAITIPSGGWEGLPYGVMLMGRRHSESLLYRAAYALEDSLSEYVKTEVRGCEV